MSHLILLTLRLFPKVRLGTSQFESALPGLTVGGLKRPETPLICDDLERWFKDVYEGVTDLIVLDIRSRNITTNIA